MGDAESGTDSPEDGSGMEEVSEGNSTASDTGLVLKWYPDGRTGLGKILLKCI